MTRRLGPHLLAALLACVLAAGCGSSDDATTAGETSAAPASGKTSTTPASPSQEAPQGVRAKGCGSVSGVAKGVRVTGVGCAEGRRLAKTWGAAENCTIPQGASRGSCRVKGKVCLSAVTDRGLAVTCASGGQSVAFIGRR